MKEDMIKDFTIDVQTLFLRIILSEPEMYVRVTNIFNPLNFDRTLRPAAEFIQT